MLQSFEVPSLPVLSCSSNESSALLWIFFPKYKLDLVPTPSWLQDEFQPMNKSLWSSSFSPSASSSIVHFLKYSPSSNQMFGVLGGTSAVYSWGSPYCLQMLGYTMLCLFVWQPPELCPFSSLCPYTLGNTSVLPSICYFICGLVISVLINYKFLLVTRSFYFFKKSSNNHKVQLSDRLVRESQEEIHRGSGIAFHRRVGRSFTLAIDWWIWWTQGLELDVGKH